MKFLVIFILVALSLSAHAISDEQKEQFKQLISHCLTTSEVDPELLPKVRSAEYTGHDSKLAAYYNCILDKLNLSVTDDAFKVDAMIAFSSQIMNKEEGAKIVKKCAVYDAAQSQDDNVLNLIFCSFKHAGKALKFSF